MRLQTSCGCLALLLSLLVAAPAHAATYTGNPYRGLWIGDVTLKYATEVTVALDKNNVPIAPNPAVPTPTADEANLRLILHVNGAGSVSLLKEVAVLNRNGTNNLVANESDFSLVSDGRLYSSFPQQVAQRFAAAAFDFGDGQANEAVDQIIDTVAGVVANSISNSTQNFSTPAGQTAAKNAAITAATTAANPIAQNADVATTFAGWLAGTSFNQAFVNQLAAAANPVATAVPALLAAWKVQTNSFYNDTRAVQMVSATVAAITNATTNQKTNAGQNTAASFADVDNQYQRFLAEKNFGDAITAAAQAAANWSTNASANPSNLAVYVYGQSQVVALQTEGIQLSTPLYTDTRASNAIALVMNAVIANAAGYGLPAAPAQRDTIATTAEQTGRDTLGTNVIRYPLPTLTPTPDYNTFIRSGDYLSSPSVAAAAAAEAAMAERRDNSLWTATSLTNAAKIAALTALQNVSVQAARAVRTELPLTGVFAPGAGDTRFTWDAHQTNSLIGAPALTGTVELAANHPTNPFRHRRHPDHTTGFDVTRNLQLSFDAAPGGLERSGYGVDRITGVYREEIFGLHKKLGPNQDIGLRVEGKLQLNRVSLIDTLNAR